MIGGGSMPSDGGMGGGMGGGGGGGMVPTRMHLTLASVTAFLLLLFSFAPPADTTT